MTLYAIDAVDDAFRTTRSFLTPVDVRTWLKLALVVFFVGGIGANFGGANFGGANVGTPTEETQVPPDATFADVGPEIWLLVAGFVALAVLVGLAFLLVGSVMEFVLVESLRNERVLLRRYWSRRWRQGLRLFGFRLVVGLLVLAGVAVLFAPLLVGLLGGDVTGASVGLFLLLVPLFIVFGIFVALVNGFTTSFVVPVMVLENCGVVDGWRRLWPTIRAEWEQYLVYALAQVLLTFAAGLVLGLLAAVSAVVLLVPFGVLGVIGVGIYMAVPVIGTAVLGIVALLYVVALILLVAVAQVPLVTYLRYYALLVLGDVDRSLDLVPTQRQAARREGSASGV